jgi:hypothetical protein
MSGRASAARAEGRWKDDSLRTVKMRYERNEMAMSYSMNLCY